MNFQFFLITAVLSLNFFPGVLFSKKSSANVLNSFNIEQETEESLEIFKRAFLLLQQNYVDPDKVDPKTLIYAAIEGMIASLKDPHTTLFTGKQRKNFLNQIEGQLTTGIGVYIAPDKEGIFIVRVIRGGPAWEIGVKANDIIVEVSGESIKGQSLEEVKKKILGAPESVVEIKVKRGKQIKKFNVKRRKIKLQTVFHRILEGDGLKVGYLKIDQFGENTDAEFENSLNFIKQAWREGDPLLKRVIVIDLRNNPGGILSVVSEIVDRFVTEGVIVSTKNRYKETEKFTSSRKVDIPKYFQTAVLINEHSASASEIMSGALKDYGRALVVGKNSYGKFSVQQIFELEPGYSALKLTVAKYYLPSGKSFEKKGITPHITVTNQQPVALLQKFYDSNLYWRMKDELVEKDPALKIALIELKKILEKKSTINLKQ